MLALTKVDFGRLSNKETVKAIGQLVGWSVFFTAITGSCIAGDRICKRFRLHERINPTDILEIINEHFIFVLLSKTMPYEETNSTPQAC